jgi:hypothetical protein
MTLSTVVGASNSWAIMNMEGSKRNPILKALFPAMLATEDNHE